jgi:hypothetical protein
MARQILHHFAGLLGILPQSGVGGADFEFGEGLFLGGQVKDSPEGAATWPALR